MRECTQCGVPFPWVQGRKGGRPKVLCSACRLENKRAESRARIARTYVPRVNPPRVCERCGTEFVPKRSDARFCTKRCKQAAMSNRRYHEDESVKRKHLDRTKNRSGRAGDWAQVLLHDPCAYCGGPTAGIDHIDPDGGNAWDNFTPACTTCNSSKSAKRLLRFLAMRSSDADRQ